MLRAVQPEHISGVNFFFVSRVWAPVQVDIHFISNIHPRHISKSIPFLASEVVLAHKLYRDSVYFSMIL